jgi:tetratricopeptide (TPR) repeat protein
VQEDLAQAVAVGLQQTLRGVDAVGLMVGGTSNARALDVYLHAKADDDASDGSEAAFKRYIAMYDQAIALDPKFAIAKAELALSIWAYISGTGSKDLAHLQELRQRAKLVAEEAVALAPNSALAHEALGTTLAVALPDFAAQEAEFARAVALAPGNSRIVGQYARFAIWAGHTTRGVEAAEQAVSLNPTSAHAYYELAWDLYMARRPDSALAALRRAQELGRIPANLVKGISGYIAMLRGDMATAQVACTGLDTFTGHECLAVADHALGKPAEAAAALAKMHDDVGVSGVFNYAEVYAQWGRTEEALRWLEITYRLQDPSLLALKTSFFLDPIRKTQRYQAIEAKLNFPP